MQEADGGSRAFQQHRHQLLLWSFLLGAPRLMTKSEISHTACLLSLGQPEELSDEASPGGTNLQSWVTFST